MPADPAPPAPPPAPPAVPPPAPDLLRNLEPLYQKVAAHAERIGSAYPDKLACRAGCAGCCATDRTVVDVEFARLRAAVDRLPAGARARLGKGRGCTMLVDDRCAVYADRPLICRSHGLPVAPGEEDGPPRDTCPLNFTDGSLALIPDGDVLSLPTVNTILGAVNMLFCREAIAAGQDAKPKRRRALRELISGGR